MDKLKVWTKQNEAVMKRLCESGRYTAERRFIMQNSESAMMQAAYDWLAANHPKAHSRPADADYPIWLSMSRDTTMVLTPGTVLLELEIDRELLTEINVAKWGAVLNRSYISLNEADDRRHRDLMRMYGVSDVKACTTQFYPELRREIENSWFRLFDKDVSLGSDYAYGTVWELRKEWICP